MSYDKRAKSVKSVKGVCTYSYHQDEPPLFNFISPHLTIPYYIELTGKREEDDEDSTTPPGTPKSAENGSATKRTSKAKRS